MAGLGEWLRQIDTKVYFLVMIFAVASWVDVNGLWVELPILVKALPEGWALPSYLTVIMQVANVGPLVYTIAHKCSPARVKEWPVIYLIIVVGMVACAMLAFFWDRTSVVMEKEHSTALIALASLLALVDCTSSVVFLPYMASFKPMYMTAYYIGEGLSGLIPGVLGLIQGVGLDPDCVNKTIPMHNVTTGENSTAYVVTPVYKDELFSIETFFFFLMTMLALSLIAFSFLHYLPACQKARVNNNYDDSTVDVASTQGLVGSKDPAGCRNSSSNSSDSIVTTSDGYPMSLRQRVDVADSGCTVNCQDKCIVTPSALQPWHYACLLGIIGWVNCLTNGILPSIQSYSSLPYSNMVYTLSVRLSSIANPLACLLALFLPPLTSLSRVFTLTVLGTLLSAYQLYLALLSPHPPWQGQIIGELLAVASMVLLTGIFSYIKLVIASILRDEGRRALLWCGAVTQLGSFVGAVLTFCLVNLLHVFTASYTDPCS